MSGCQNPDDLCSIPSSLSPSLSRSFRDAGFFFRGVHVYEICFRELSRKFLERISWAPILYTHTETFVPELLLLLLPCSFSTWPSTASSRSQWALPDLSRERQISVPKCKQPPRISMEHCNSLIKFPGRGPSQLVTAFADLSRSFRETFADFRARSREIW